MEEPSWIPVETVCAYHDVDRSLILTIEDQGLVEFRREETAVFVSSDRLGDLERILRLHRELDINLEGVAALTHVLERVRELQDEVRRLRQRLGEAEGQADG